MVLGNHSVDISAGAKKSPSLSGAAASSEDLDLELDSLSIRMPKELENKVGIAAKDECCTHAAASFQEFYARSLPRHGFLQLSLPRCRAW
jgi:hypothetical protein